ncbi:MAG: 50S ribosomal protein L25 [Planctomycetota bacterium]
MEEIKLKATLRKELGSRAVKKLRREGKVPGVIYARGIQTASISIDTAEIEKALLKGSRMLNITLDGEEMKVIVREVQHSPLSDDILHVDLHHVAATEKATVPVRIEIFGEPSCPPEEGVLEQHMSEISMECLLTDLPDKFVIDVRKLGPGDVIRVRDLKRTQGITIMEEEEDIVVSVTEPAQEEEGEVKPPEEGAEPEIIGKAKEEESE